jgi:hypothetical protein
MGGTHSLDEGKEMYTHSSWGNFMGGSHLEDQEIDGKLILKWFTLKWVVRLFTALYLLGFLSISGPLFWQC